MIINDRQDFDALPQAEQDAYKQRLAAGIYGWSWEDGDWVQTTSTESIERFGFTLEEFADAPVPDKPTSNPDEEAKAQALAEAKRSRAAAYTAEADPLFFKAQRGEATLEEWQAKVDEIRERFPYPSDPINVNTATKDELKSLSGVDAVRAQAIIDGRPWSSVGDLATIQGISSDMIAGWDITI